LVWRRAIAARKFLKNQGFPVFQKLWRFSVQCQLNATWYQAARLAEGRARTEAPEAGPEGRRCLQKWGYAEAVAKALAEAKKRKAPLRIAFQERGQDRQDKRPQEMLCAEADAPRRRW
jgi:hypothetical protein